MYLNLILHSFFKRMSTQFCRNVPPAFIIDNDNIQMHLESSIKTNNIPFKYHFIYNLFKFIKRVAFCKTFKVFNPSNIC